MNIENKNIFEEYSKSIPPETKRFGELTFDISQLIYDTLKNKNISQEEFAETLGKKPSEISKWLNGIHNFTLKTIAKIETVLDFKLINVANEKKLFLSSNYKDAVSIFGSESLKYFTQNKEGKETIIFEMKQTTKQKLTLNDFDYGQTG